MPLLVGLVFPLLQIWVYDLSHGMMAAMSESLLGKLGVVPVLAVLLRTLVCMCVSVSVLWGWGAFNQGSWKHFAMHHPSTFTDRLTPTHHARTRTRTRTHVHTRTRAR